MNAGRSRRLVPAKKHGGERCEDLVHGGSEGRVKDSKHITVNFWDLKIGYFSSFFQKILTPVHKSTFIN